MSNKSIFTVRWAFIFLIGLGVRAQASAPSSFDNARTLVDTLKYDDLISMRTAKLEQSTLPAEPWSGWYWPFYQGGLAYRYADPLFPKSTVLSEILDFILGSLGKGPELSPAEKYDLLVGDENFTLTKSMIQLASERTIGGTVPQWLGYCGGWANAAMNFPKPQRSVLALAPDGHTSIEFTPIDLEALATLLWANGTFSYRMAGSLCQQSPVSYDSNGRATDPACRDINPATWHLAIVNQIGVSHRGLVIDTDPGYQIWNNPVFSYSYHYFNPATNLPAASLEEAEVSLSNFPKDVFAAFRAPNARSVVGIEMQSTFTFFQNPGAPAPTPPAENETRTPVYRYDLELDAQDKIIGGEWHLPLHPDVIWVAAPGTHPLSVGDAQLDGTPDWERGTPLSKNWQDAAQIASKRTQLIDRIVENLLTQSRQ